jgi:hypothetical protein
MPAAQAPDLLQALRRNLSFQDRVTVVFHSYMLARVLLAPDGPRKAEALAWSVGLLLTTVFTVITVRGELLAPGPVRSWLYMLGLFVPMPLSYMEMDSLLHSLQPVLIDDQLLRWDLALFGVTPAAFFDQYVTVGTTEWFAFFYYSYYFILGFNLVPTLLWDTGQRKMEMLIGAAVVVCLGQFTYTWVPGLGPLKAMTFVHPHVGGTMWALVLKAVAAGGAQLDIFPSLHTAFPLFFALNAIRQRRTAPFRYVWPVALFFSLNIIVATLFLRWHWGVDVIAGVVLATLALVISGRVARQEADRGPDRQPVWEPLWGRSEAIQGQTAQATS